MSPSVTTIHVRSSAPPNLTRKPPNSPPLTGIGGDTMNARSFRQKGVSSVMFHLHLFSPHNLSNLYPCFLSLSSHFLTRRSIPTFICRYLPHSHSCRGKWYTPSRCSYWFTLERPGRYLSGDCLQKNPACCASKVRAYRSWHFSRSIVVVIMDILQTYRPLPPMIWSCAIGICGWRLVVERLDITRQFLIPVGPKPSPP